MRFRVFFLALTTVLGLWRSLHAQPLPALDSLRQSLFSNPETYRQAWNPAHYASRTDSQHCQLWALYAISYAVQGQSDLAMSAFNSALSLAPAQTLERVRILKNMGTTQRNAGNFKECFEFYYQALNDLYALSDSLLLAETYGEIASAYALVDKLDIAAEYLDQGIAILEQSPPEDATYLGIAYHKLANIFLRQKEYSLAQNYYRKVLKALKPTYRKDVYYFSLAHYAMALDTLGQSDSALYFLDRAITGLRESNQPAKLVYVYGRYAQYYQAIGAMDSARALFSRARALSHSEPFNFSLALEVEYLQFLKKIGAARKRNAIFESAQLEANLGQFPPQDQNLYWQEKAQWWSEQGEFEKAYRLQEAQRLKANQRAAQLNEYALFGLKRKYETSLLRQENEHLAKIQASQTRLYRLLLLLSFFVVLTLLALYRLRNYKFKLSLLKARNLALENQRYQKTLADQRTEIIHQSNENLLLKNQLQQFAQSLKGEDGNWNLEILGVGDQLLRNLILRSEKADPQWFTHLRQLAPQLNRNDIEFCLLLYLGFANKEIAQLLNISHSSVHTRRYRLRKKLELCEGQDLLNWLAMVNQNWCPSFSFLLL